jgi:hypothetical protein
MVADAEGTGVLERADVDIEVEVSRRDTGVEGLVAIEEQAVSGEDLRVRGSEHAGTRAVTDGESGDLAGEQEDASDEREGCDFHGVRIKETSDAGSGSGVSSRSKWRGEDGAGNASF